MEDVRFTYSVNPRRNIKGVGETVISGRKTLKLNKEEVLLCMKCGPVYRWFANEDLIKRVTGANLDRLHNEKYISEQEWNRMQLNYVSNVVETAQKEEPVAEKVVEETVVEAPVVEEVVEEPVIEEPVEETVEEVVEESTESEDEEEYVEDDEEEEVEETVVPQTTTSNNITVNYSGKKKKKHK